MTPRPSTVHVVNRLWLLSTSSSPTTALFYARLWYSLFPPSELDHESLHVLALCFLQAEQPYSALHLVRDTADPDADDENDANSARYRRPGCFGCAIVVANCCERLSRFSEGKAVLERALKGSLPMTLPNLCPASPSASAHLLLASLSDKGKAREQAVEQYTKALQEDPWLWEAFTGLCDIGSAPSPDLLFADPSAPARSSSSRTSLPPTLSPNPMPRSSASEMPGLMPSRRQLSPLANGGGGFFTPDVVNGGSGLPRLGMMGNASAWETPSVVGDTTFPALMGHPSVPAPTRRPLPNLISAFIPSASSMLPVSFRSTTTPANAEPVPARPPAMKRSRGGNGVKKAMETPQSGAVLSRELRAIKSIEPNGEEHPPRRSTRLKSTSTKPSSKMTREQRTTRSRSATSSASGATIDTSSTPSQDAQLQLAADDWLRDIVRRCARAYRTLSLYQCQEAMREIDTLPPEIHSSAWALDIIARSYYEMANYILARRAFEALLEVEPYRLQSMEAYSTLLWHLGDPPSLSHLSQSLIAIDREAPQPWIAAGNCFSLQKNHDEAMRCFRRAAQVDPGCAYAWTLCGYEAIEMEEYERAIAFYRTAIRTDARHYNAWYGMGLVYLKTGKHKYAEHHFRRAAEINPTNAVLLCCIGMVLEQLDDSMQALTYYELACKYAPDSPMVTFKRIRLLVKLQRIEEAIAGLEPLSREAPDEANIHFLLGKCYLRQGRRGDATVAFTSARELQPKLEGAIKSAMEADGEEDEGEE